MADQNTQSLELPPSAFRKQDAGDDAAFYAPPRLVTHLDQAAIDALTAFYRSLLPSGGVLLDLRFDAALCCVGVQYLQRPVEVCGEVLRVLRPGAPFIVSFSNRCFPTKAVAIWRSLDTQGHASLVRLYLEQAGFNNLSVEVLRDGRESDPLIAVTGRH